MRKRGKPCSISWGSEQIEIKTSEVWATENSRVEEKKISIRSTLNTMTVLKTDLNVVVKIMNKILDLIQHSISVSRLTILILIKVNLLNHWAAKINPLLMIRNVEQQKKTKKKQIIKRLSPNFILMMMIMVMKS